MANIKFFLFISIIFFAVTTIDGRGQSSKSPEALLQEQAKVIEKWGTDSIIAKAVMEQNAKKIALAEIQTIDKVWCTTTGVDDRMKRLMTNPCAERLKTLSNNASLYKEAFVMDNQGAIVAMTDKTSDYWQGDEPKWIRSFNNGKGAVFIDKPQYDASAKAILAQISVPVKGPGGMVIGSITVGVITDKKPATAKK